MGKSKKYVLFLLMLVLTTALCGCSVSVSVSSGSDESENESAEVSKQVEDLTISLSDFDEDEEYVLLTLKNESSSTVYGADISKIVINGSVQVASSISLEAEPESEDSYDISLNVYEDIGTYAALAFYIEITEDGEDLAESVLYLYPSGDESDEVYVRDAADTDTVLADNEAVTVIVTGYCQYEDPEDYYTIDLYFENKTDEDVIFSLEEVYVNGLDSGTVFSRSVSSGNCMFSACYFVTSAMESYGIETVEEISLVLGAQSADDGTVYVSEAFTLTP